VYGRKKPPVSVRDGPRPKTLFCRFMVIKSQLIAPV
jgi:hypothetical protein